MSPIYQLKAFNNWIKAILFKKYVQEGDVALDIACGKGGDLKKWAHACISTLVGIDIASGSIEDAKHRYQECTYEFDAHFFTADCFTESITDISPYINQTSFDVCSMQFALHYCFETEAKARMLLQNIANTLKLGGIFFGTLPDAFWLVYAQ